MSSSVPRRLAKGTLMLTPEQVSKAISDVLRNEEIPAGMKFTEVKRRIPLLSFHAFENHVGKAAREDPTLAAAAGRALEEEKENAPLVRVTENRRGSNAPRNQHDWLVQEERPTLEAENENAQITGNLFSNRLKRKRENADSDAIFTRAQVIEMLLEHKEELCRAYKGIIHAQEAHLRTLLQE